MAKKFQKLNQTFNIDVDEDDDGTQELSFVEATAEIIEASTPIPVPAPELTQEQQEIRKDYEYSRANLYSIIEKGQEAINGVLDLAQESETPRAYEVVGQLIKNVSDATDKLLDIQKKIKEIDNIKNRGNGPRSVTNNAVFVGSTAELTKFLKGHLQGVEDDK